MEVRRREVYERQRNRVTAVAVVLIVSIGLLVLLGIGVVAWVSGAVDPNAAPKQTATNYVHARLANNYGAWWDAVTPACKVSPGARVRSQWIAGKKQLAAGFNMSAPADTKVEVTSITGSGSHRTVEVYVSNRLGGEYQALTERETNGRWGVDGYGAPGAVEPCNVL